MDSGTEGLSFFLHLIYHAGQTKPEESFFLSAYDLDS